MHFLEKALNIAVTQHAGQTDKAGKPYILHPLRVMMKMENDEEMAAAVLHDVIEDTSISAEDLLDNGIPEKVVEIVKTVTKREGESYDDFISRISAYEPAVRVKISDIRDNMDICRLEVLTEKDLQRLKKYHKALKDLSESLKP